MGKRTISRDDVLRLFEYRDGGLYWRQNPGGRGRAGERAGGVDGLGYRVVGIDNVAHKEHRLIFLMAHGYLPPMVDHIDGDPTNNKIENLRIADNKTNQQNRKPTRGRDPALKNITYRASRKKWFVGIRDGSKSAKHIGCFDNLDAAKVAAHEAREALHKEYARHP